jgi:acetoacetate decarboxylase
MDRREKIVNTLTYGQLNIQSVRINIYKKYIDNKKKHLKHLKKPNYTNKKLKEYEARWINRKQDIIAIMLNPYSDL